jgi:UDP-perosamine 4-acetyltransferase
MSASFAGSNRPIGVLGGGGHARVVIEALRRCGATVAGVIDPEPAVAAALPKHIAYLGKALEMLDPAQYDVAIGVGSVDVGDANPRPRLFDEAKRAGFVVRGVLHPSAIVPEGLVLGEGTQVMAGAVLQPGVRIGVNCIINTSASLDHDCRLGDHIHVAPGAVLSGGVSIGDGCHIGTGAIIIQGIVIGAEAMIPAGAVVTRNVPPGVRLKRDAR